MDLRRGPSLWSYDGQAKIAFLLLLPHTAYGRNALQAMYKNMEAEIENLTQQVAEQAGQRSGARRLLTHPGVGPITALATDVFLGDAKRFAYSKVLASYVGLIPREYSSGARQRLGGVTKQGSPLLRFLWRDICGDATPQRYSRDIITANCASRFRQRSICGESMHYDLIVVGGGVAGSSLAWRMAANGARVLVLEREVEFRDRIRGEALQPWGVAELRKLGIFETLQPAVAELRWFEQSINGERAFRRDLVTTTMPAEPMWGMYHPEMQEKLLTKASAAGAEVRRGATVQQVMPGPRPKVVVGGMGQAAEFEAHLVVLCAGRNPTLRAQLGFKVQRGSIPLLLSGVWLSGLAAEVDHSVAYVANDVSTGALAALFPQRGDRARAYFGFHPQKCSRLQGEGDFARFRQMFIATAGKTIPFGDAKPVGALASFECADVWVEHPYRDGVALAGDAASSNDPSWGQGLSLAFRDARVLSDELLAGTDWDAAANRFAERHDADYGVVRKVSGWFYDVFQRLGPEADARRARALPLIAQDPTRVPDVLFSGPEFPMDGTSHARFFGEDSLAAPPQPRR